MSVEKISFQKCMHVGKCISNCSINVIALISACKCAPNAWLLEIHFHPLSRCKVHGRRGSWRRHLALSILFIPWLWAFSTQFA